MAGSKEILEHINSIKETMRITNAMYLISSSKFRAARRKEQKVDDYFETMQKTISDIIVHVPELTHPYLETKTGQSLPSAGNRRGYIVITADKGLAGAYNTNVMKLAQRKLSEYPNSKLFVVGHVGYQYFKGRHADMDEGFMYSAQTPSLQRARNITEELLDPFNDGELQEIYLIYTHMKNAISSEPVCMKLLPLSREQFYQDADSGNRKEEFFPDAESVFKQLAPIVMHGIIFGALTESYCAELNDRMMAMDNATKNASQMIQNLQLEYNRSRQGSITQEITEIIAGSTAQKRRHKS